MCVYHTYARVCTHIHTDNIHVICLYICVCICVYVYIHIDRQSLREGRITGVVIPMPENTHCDLGIFNFKTFLLLFPHLKIDAMFSSHSAVFSNSYYVKGSKHYFNNDKPI